MNTIDDTLFDDDDLLYKKDDNDPLEADDYTDTSMYTPFRLRFDPPYCGCAEP